MSSFLWKDNINSEGCLIFCFWHFTSSRRVFFPQWWRRYVSMNLLSFIFLSPSGCLDLERHAKPTAWRIKGRCVFLCSAWIWSITSRSMCGTASAPLHRLGCTPWCPRPYPKYAGCWGAGRLQGWGAGTARSLLPPDPRSEKRSLQDTFVAHKMQLADDFRGM